MSTKRAPTDTHKQPPAATYETYEYVALIRKEENTAYCIDIPDFPGCIAAADSQEEALSQFHEALAFHLEGLAEDGLELPAPRSLSDIAAAESAGSYQEAFIIEVARPDPSQSDK